MSEVRGDKAIASRISLGAILVVISSSVVAQDICVPESSTSPVDRMLNLVMREKKACSENAMHDDDILKLDSLYYDVNSDDVDYRDKLVNMSGFDKSSASIFGDGARDISQSIYKQKSQREGSSSSDALPTLDGYQILKER
jgi:hypothetical protein